MEGGSAHAIPLDELAAVFGRRLDAPVVQSLYAPVASATAGVWKVIAGERSAVVKVLQPAISTGQQTWRAGASSSDPYWWRREAAAFESGVFASLPGDGLEAPSCHGVFNRPDGTTAIWMEDLSSEKPATEMNITELHEVLRRLGRLQADWIERPALDLPFWSAGWLEAYVERHAEGLEVFDDPRPAAHPLLRHVLDPRDVAEVRSVWEEREIFVRWAAATPTTLAHFDLTPKNLISRGATFIALDWAFAGRGAVGADSGPFFINAAADFLASPDELADLITAGNAAFAAGLQDRGLHVDPKQLELAAAATAAVKFAWLLTAVLTAAVSNWTTFNGKPRDEGMAWWARLTPVLRERANTARQLGTR